jgi:uncharacterized protein
MHLAVFQFELHIPGAESLKDKRRVVRSLKDKLHREHMVAVAEVAYLDNPAVAGMALTAVSRDPKHLATVLDRISAKLRSLPDAELGESSREILSSGQLPGDDRADDGSPLWTPEESREPLPPSAGSETA